MVGIPGMIGGSIFVLTDPAIELTGSSVRIAFMINATITIFTAIGYAELGSAMPEAGGGRTATTAKCLIEWMDGMVAHIVVGSLYAVGFGSFLQIY
jgi:basic amino acid/polyamine antiporter, APA family